MRSASAAQQILTAFRTLLSRDIECIDEIGCRIAIPRFTSALIASLIDSAIQVFQAQPTLLKLSPPIYIVGDIHGSLHDLLRILKTISLRETNNKVLFLGDYIDRGPFSTEVMSILTALAVELPDRCFLLRGNHETREVCERYGFRDELIDTYGNDELWTSFTRMFEYLPLAALVGPDIFCVHGGITPELETIDIIDEIQRPIDGEDSELVQHLLWADPSTEYVEFSPSRRGKGITFGVDAVNDFFARTGIRRIIRAHQCVEEGVEASLGGSCITVFSSSWYKLELSNQAAILRVLSSTRITPVTFPPIAKMARACAKFAPVSSSFLRTETLAFFPGIARVGSMRAIELRSFRTDASQKETKPQRANSRRGAAMIILRSHAKTPA